MAKNASPAKFLSQIKQEFAKITWPERKKTILSTAMVFLMVFLLSMFFFVLDLGLGGIVNLLLNI